MSLADSRTVAESPIPLAHPMVAGMQDAVHAPGQPSLASGEEVPLRLQIAVYGIALFSTSIFHIGAVIVPLFAATMSPSPVMFGLVFSAAHILPLLLSIHAGAMMDRLGARRLMVVCTAIGAMVPLFYPAFPFIWALIVFQMFFGLAETMGWLGAQTMIGQYMYGKTVYAGRMSFIIRIGHFLCAPLAGIAWDVAGAWGGFGLMALWGLGSVACALLLPRAEATSAPKPAEGRGGRLRALLPNASDYVTAFRLLGVPSVVIIVLLGALMHVGNSVQNSFYVAWLDDMGLTGTAIGMLGPAAAIGAALFSLVTARLMRYIGGLWIALGSLWAGILLICATPLFGTYLLLQVAMFLRSGANGLAQPLVITLVLRGAGADNQGKAIGLRGTANRIASILSPLLMGAIAEAAGVEYAFYIVGALVSVAMLGIALYLWLHPEVAKAGED
ncbi:MAG: MFS transporter [Hyphomicrobiales bacterium]|nr:MFS transporter [Hyphomicrobiales bacterium]